MFRNNLLINSNVTKAIYNSPPKRYIYIGTACSFPKKLQLSTESLPLTEEDQFPASAESGYGWSKLMGEIEARYLSKEGITNKKIVIEEINNNLRYFNINTNKFSSKKGTKFYLNLRENIKLIYNSIIK